MDGILEGADMLFNSYIFIFLFLPLVLLGYYGLNHIKQYKLALGYVVAMSMWFYGYNSLQYLVILIISILLNFSIVEVMAKVRKQNVRKLMLYMGIILNIGILFYYKYFDFFVENVNAIFKTDLAFLQLVLPLGISFYTFQQLSYVVDSYRKECEHYSLLEYAAYVSFFPQLIAGPIVYHDEIIPQFRDIEKRKFSYENMSRGIYAFALGLGKKVLIADTFSRLVTVGFGELYQLNSTTALLIMICYSLQIYFDFSGYCDMAYGIGYMFNIQIPINFNSPYKATTISEFWDRWHITLSRFFTKYIYIPLGGNRRGKYRTYLNIFIVFLISGLWHGANWTFILWGIMHGIAKIIDRVCDRLISRIPRWIRWFFTFGFVTFAWSLFRSKSVFHAKILWQQLCSNSWGAVSTAVTDAFDNMIEMEMFYRVGSILGVEMSSVFCLVLFTVIALLACVLMRNTQEKVAAGCFKNSKILVVVIIGLWSILSLSEVSEFLYFNF